MFKKNFFIAIIGLISLLVLSTSITVMAEPSAEFISTSNLTLSEFEALYPMSAEAEAAIVHVVPQVPVTINGVLYNPEDIKLFNGQRLHFTLDNEGNLYAFTSAKDLEKFINNEFGQSELINNNNGATRAAVALWEHITYLGDSISLSANEARASFGDFNDKASSFVVGQGLDSGVIWEHENFEEDSFTRPGGTAIPFLGLYGWNDIASSAARFD